MADLTIYRERWEAAFAQPGAFTGPIANYPKLYAGEGIKVVQLGTMQNDDSEGHTADEAGAAFYALGDDDPLRYLVPDDSTYAWDQRDVIAEVSYQFATLAYQYGLVLALAKGLVSANAAWYLELQEDATWRVRYHEHGGANVFTSWPATEYVDGLNDGIFHRIKVIVQPGTVTGDPLEDGFTVAADGYWEVYVDGALSYRRDNLALSMGYTSVNAFIRSPVHLRSAWVGFSGLLGPTQDLHLYRVTYNTVDASIPCCTTCACTTTAGTIAAGATGPILPTITALWTPACVGGGTVLTVSDLAHSESWAN